MYSLIRQKESKKLKIFNTSYLNKFSYSFNLLSQNDSQHILECTRSQLQEGALVKVLKHEWKIQENKKDDENKQNNEIESSSSDADDGIDDWVSRVEKQRKTMSLFMKKTFENVSDLDDENEQENGFENRYEKSRPKRKRKNIKDDCKHQNNKHDSSTNHSSDESDDCVSPIPKKRKMINSPIQKSAKKKSNQITNTFEPESGSESEYSCHSESEVDGSDYDETDLEDNVVGDEIEILRSDRDVSLPDLSVISSSNNEQRPYLLRTNRTKVLMSSSWNDEVDESADQGSQLLLDDSKKDPNFTVSAEKVDSPDQSLELREKNTSENSELKVLNNSSLINISSNINVEGLEAPDYETLKIEPVKKGENGKRIRKKHLCTLCTVPSDHINLKRHMERCHSDNPQVQAMMKETVINKRSRKPMKELIHKGDNEYNKYKKLNKGNLRVVRAPPVAAKVNASDYTECPKCKGMYMESEYRTHFRQCTGVSGAGCRNLASIGRKLVPNCHQKANTVLRQNILARMRNDKIVRLIRYDPLIIEYGNEICDNLRGVQHKTNICTQLRRLGRLKDVLKIDKLAKVIISNNSLAVVKAIEKLASNSKNPDAEYLASGTLARNMSTLVKAVTKTYEVMCIEDPDTYGPSTNAEKFATCFEKYYKRRLSRMAAESVGYQRRHRNNELPTTDDINLLLKYLNEQRMLYYNKLETQYDEEAHKGLIKTTLSSLQAYNRRRPGDVERILVDDVQTMNRIDNFKNKEYENLNNNLKDLAKEFSLLYTRGKLGNDIKLLVTPEINICIQKLIALRSKLNLSSRNKYLFGLPKIATSSIRYPSAYCLLKRFAEDCGAVNPHLIRATRLRKQLATACISLNLNDAQLSDLAGYMGHHVNIHKSHYRQNIVSRDIPLFIKFINAALEQQTENQPEETSLNTSVIEEETSLRDDSINDYDQPSTSKQPDLCKSSTTLNEKSTKKSRRVPYSEEEIRIVYDTFGDYMTQKGSKVPRLEEIKAMLIKHEDKFHESRNPVSVKTWMYCKKKNN